MENLGLVDPDKFFIEPNSDGLKYHSASLDVIVQQGKSSGEIRCLFKLPESNESVSLNDILGSQGKRALFLYPRSEADLSYISNVFSSELIPILSSNEEQVKSIISSAIKFRAESDKITTYGYVILPIKEKADTAWKEKNFIEVVRLYESILESLTDIELKRLKYSKKSLLKEK